MPVMFVLLFCICFFLNVGVSSGITCDNLNNSHSVYVPPPDKVPVIVPQWTSKLFRDNDNPLPGYVERLKNPVLCMWNMKSVKKVYSRNGEYRWRIYRMDESQKNKLDLYYNEETKEWELVFGKRRISVTMYIYKFEKLEDLWKDQYLSWLSFLHKNIKDGDIIIQMRFGMNVPEEWQGNLIFRLNKKGLYYLGGHYIANAEFAIM